MWRDLGDLDQEHPKQDLTDDDLDDDDLDDDDDDEKEYPKQNLTDDDGNIRDILLSRSMMIFTRMMTCALHISLVIYFDICPG